MGYDIGFIGTGADPDDPDQDGFAMAYRHAAGYETLDSCQLTACADIVRENAERFAAEYGIEHVYEQYERMLAETQPDIVSVCVPPGIHADIVVGCAETGVPDAIHCEKPMAKTWGDCREMVEACEAEGIQLSFNHQKRFGGPVREAKRLLDDGAIGELERLEFSEEHLYDTGTHVFDICSYMTDGEPVEWVMGQVDYREENVWFGAHNENHGLTTWAYADGTRGLAMTGEGATTSTVISVCAGARAVSKSVRPRARRCDSAGVTGGREWTRTAKASTARRRADSGECGISWSRGSPLSPPTAVPVRPTPSVPSQKSSRRSRRGGRRKSVAGLRCGRPSSSSRAGSQRGVAPASTCRWTSTTTR
ncbi:Gfo/Idh/MocA family protein [Halomicroarcula sp. GCM10025894]|uniref:Gfo/Idh/MocA family protein n=1 Tax=Halomicroarcula sp. GCM10025894 TaxID=3252673 RepID=UPI00360F183D